MTDSSSLLHLTLPAPSNSHGFWNTDHRSGRCVLLANPADRRLPRTEPWLASPCRSVPRRSRHGARSVRAQGVEETQCSGEKDIAGPVRGAVESNRVFSRSSKRKTLVRPTRFGRSRFSNMKEGHRIKWIQGLELNRTPLSV